MINKKILKDFAFACGFWFIIGVITFIIVDSFVMPYFAGQFKNEVQVPNVLNLEESEARQIINDNTLQVRFNEDGEYSSTIPKGHIKYQAPQAGQTVKEGRHINLTISLGVREITVPKLRGSSKRQAEISLNRKGLELGQVIYSSHSRIPKGVIIRTIPDANTIVRVGDSVSLVISSTRKQGTHHLPDLRNLSLQDAKKTLDSLGFRLGELTVESDSTNLPNTVIRQQPKHGEFLPENFKINLTVVE